MNSQPAPGTNWTNWSTNVTPPNHPIRIAKMVNRFKKSLFWQINKPVEFFYIKHDNRLTRPLCSILMALRDLFRYEV